MLRFKNNPISIILSSILEFKKSREPGVAFFVRFINSKKRGNVNHLLVVILVLLSFIDGILKKYYHHNFSLFLCYVFIYFFYSFFKKVKRLNIILAIISTLVSFKALGFLKTSCAFLFRIDKKNFKHFLWAYLIGQLVFCFNEVLFYPSLWSKSFYGLTNEYLLLFGIEGDANFSFATSLFCCLLLLKLSDVKYRKVLLVFGILILIAFRSKGGLIALIFYCLSKFINFKKDWYYGILVLAILAFFAFFIFFLIYTSDSNKVIISKITTYRSDIWLRLLDKPYVVYSSYNITNFEAHNFFIQMINYGISGFLFLLFFIYYLVIHSNRFTFCFIVFWLISSFSLNSGSSNIFIFLLLFFQVCLQESYLNGNSFFIQHITNQKKDNKNIQIV